MHYDNIPDNPMMLLSFMNTKLRDEGMNLKELCYDLEVNEEDVVLKLSMIDYKYDEKLNKFV